MQAGKGNSTGCKIEGDKPETVSKLEKKKTQTKPQKCGKHLTTPPNPKGLQAQTCQKFIQTR